MESVILVEGITKCYRSGEHVIPPHRMLKNEIEHIVRRCCGKHSAVRESHRKFEALKDISFSVQKGECLGILGKNGSGKSTLIRIIAGLTKPSAGSVTVHGETGILAGVGLGMHPELTGRENIYISGGIMGLSKRTIDERMDAIIEFSELEHVLATPIKFYSNGMRARLSFSVSIHLDHPDILLIDEVLAAGDLAFQQKCLERMETLIKGGTTIVLATHSIGYLSHLADNCIYLREGRLAEWGKTNIAIAAYCRDIRIQLPKKEALSPVHL